MSAPSTLETHGWTAQPRDVSAFLGDKQDLKAPEPQTVASIALPSTPLAKAVLDYAKKELREETFNHSMRVYYYGKPHPPARKHHHAPRPAIADYSAHLPGKAIQTHLSPTHPLPVSDETYLLTCLLHDIGTTDKNLPATLMSFEFYGGYLALDLLKKQLRAPVGQAESVAEAIIRHQDLGASGKISSLGLLIQLATVFGGSSFYFTPLPLRATGGRKDRG